MKKITLIALAAILLSATMLLSCGDGAGGGGSSGGVPLGRVVGHSDNPDFFALYNNFGRSDMPGEWEQNDKADLDGEDVSDSEPNGGYNTNDCWSLAIGWDFTTIWFWDITLKLPILMWEVKIE